jgi:hypothetical protein
MPSPTAPHRTARQKPPRPPPWQSRTPRSRCHRGASSLAMSRTNNGQGTESGAPAQFRGTKMVAGLGNLFLYRGHHDGFITFPTSEICGESKIFVGTEAKTGEECNASGGIGGLPRVLGDREPVGTPYCSVANGPRGSPPRIRPPAATLSRVAGSGPRPSAKARSSKRRPCNIPGRL